MLGIVYLPPVGSRYAHNDMFTDIEVSVLSDTENEIPVDDFNARTRNLVTTAVRGYEYWN